jgi:hypothetical protein
MDITEVRSEARGVTTGRDQGIDIGMLRSTEPLWYRPDERDPGRP